MNQNGFFARMKQKLVSFMSGRYGVDSLYYVLFVTAMIVLLVSSFITNDMIRIILNAVSIALFVIAVARMLSKKLDKRYREAQAFSKFTYSLKSFFTLQSKKIKEFKTHRFRRCPKCKEVLRLPAQKGKHTVHCPKCGENFKVNIILK